MRALPLALEPFAEYRQFILWMSVQRDGKTAKLPVDHRTGAVANAHNPEIWLSAPDAILAASAGGFGVGFVFTAHDPFFFLDLDGCTTPDGTGWNATAQTILAALPGAAVEVSQSGKGLHVFARGSAPGHKCKNIPLGLELYTSGRFVALTGAGAIGSAAVDLTGPLAAVVAEYFPPDGPDDDPGAPAEWTDSPAGGWDGPEDDGELIRKALKSKSAGSIFGSGCTFADLWTADPAALAAAYPDDSRDYDASSADAAIAQHLAFWTGGNCERIHRIMWQSALVRDKWERADYLQRTISGAAARQEKYYCKPKPLEHPAATPTAAPTVVSGYQYLGADGQIEHFRGCVYIQSLHRAFTPGGALLKSEQFNATYGGYAFQLDEKTKTVKKAWEAFTESQLVRYPQAEGVCFRPELAPGAIVTEENIKLVNTYVPIDTPRQQGDPGPFLSHLARVLPDPGDREILLSYLAACVQHKGVKFQWCPLLQGTEGNGKTLFTRCVAFAVGNRYTHLPKASDLDNKFNAWISGKLFIGVEDIYVPENKREVIEAIKPLITNDRLEIQAKGSDQITGDNRANFILNTNLRDAIRKTRNDRRFAVFFTAQQNAEDLARDGMNGDYFPELYAWLRGGGYAIVADFLATYAIPENLNPAGACHRAPDTSTTETAIFESLGTLEQEILEAIEEGKTGFSGGWVSSMALDRLLLTLRAGRAIPRNRRREVLQRLGYDWHPALSGGRCTSVVMVDGGKPRLFIRTGHPAATLGTQAEVVEAYTSAQRGGDAATVDNFLGSM